MTKEEKFEKLVNTIIKECEADGEPVTRKEAEDMAEMELGYKAMNHYTKSDKPRKKKTPRTYTASDEKKQLFEAVFRNLQADFDEVVTIKQDKLMAVRIGNKIFKVDLIQVTDKKRAEVEAYFN